MKAAFDSEALSYDQDFTNSLIGKHQRNLIWQYLERFNHSTLNILEVNCGTGEDAIFLNGKGHRVKACDISNEMIEVAVKKSRVKDVKIDFFQKDIRDLNADDFNGVDLVFSNFGGLNCLTNRELDGFMEKADQHLRTNASFIAVVMPPFCLTESMYFLLKFKFRKIFRRMNRSGVQWADRNQRIYYFSPARLKRHTKHLKHKHLQAIGLFTPPSYLNKFAEKKKGLFKILISLDKIFDRIPLSAYLSDHYLIHLQKKE